MSSLRRINRQLLTWARYERKVYGPTLGTSSHAYSRVLWRFARERQRRFRPVLIAARAAHQAKLAAEKETP